MEFSIEILSALVPLVIGAVWVFYSLNRKEKRLQAIADQRDSSFEGFYSSLDPSPDKELAEIIYETLQVQLEWVCLDFPVFPTDLLKQDFDLDQDDIKFLINQATDKCGALENPISVPPFRTMSVGELVTFLSSRIRKPQPTA